MEEFVEGNFFNGDLYIDFGRKTYQEIGYKHFGFFEMIASLFHKPARDAIAKNKKDNLPSNLKGYANQNGGTLVITKGGGEILLDYRQDNPADHVALADVLRVLGIPNPDAADAGQSSSSPGGSKI